MGRIKAAGKYGMHISSYISIIYTISFISFIIDYRYVLIYCQTKYNRCQNWTDCEQERVEPHKA